VLDDRPPTLDTPSLRKLRRNLIRWYQRHGRDLPWRRTADPYRIWVSEIMLQQTTVAAVIPYFERFLNSFPTVTALASAPEEAVLRHWEGLGYYRRARNLHAAAQRIQDDHGGVFPGTVDELRCLPGIGRYTAGAIASFAFDQRAPIVEANTQRLYARILGYLGDLHSTAGQRLLWRFAETVLPQNEPGRFNQALIELGGVVCKPNDPECPSCPIRTVCRACQESAQSEIPRARTREEITEVVEACVVVRKRNALLLRQRPPEERWAGLWDFPRVEVACSPEDDAPAPAAIEALMTNGHSLGVSARVTHRLTEIRHSVTRYRIRLICYEAEHLGGRLQQSGALFRWADWNQLADLPLSVPARRIVRFLADS